MKATLTLLLTTCIIFYCTGAMPTAAPLPGPRVTIQSTGPTCTDPCSGSDSAMVTNGFKPYRYLWNNGDTTPAIHNLCSGQYIIIVTDSLGDTATDTTSISLPPAPQVNITPSGDSIAGADSAHLCATPAYPQYLWSTGDTTPCIYALTEGIYYVTVTDSNNCLGVSNSVFIYKCPVPDITIVLSGDTLYTYGGSGSCRLTYMLFRNDTPVVSNGNILVLPAPGNYELLVTGDSTCCGIDSSAVIYEWYGTYTGINEISDNALPLYIYPNPATGSIQLQYGNYLPGTGIEIYNPLGQLVQQQTVRQPGAKQQLDISALPPGLYLIAIKQDNAVVASGKVVKCN